MFIVKAIRYIAKQKTTSVHAGAVLMPLAMFLLLLKSSFYNEFY